MVSAQNRCLKTLIDERLANVFSWELHFESMNQRAAATGADVGGGGVGGVRHRIFSI